MNVKSGRPRIPAQTERELWGRSAGRCQFRGCNELLYLDGLTQQRSNLAHISHIVAFSPDGPRGNPTRSQELATDIGNLMLTCRVHGKIIDDTERVPEYPEKLLLEFKREHEQRIRMLTESKEDAQTYVLLLQASIDGRDVRINPTDAFRAILPKYPAEERPMVIDLSGLRLTADGEGVITPMARSITEQTCRLLRRSSGEPPIKNLSVFALAPIPLLVHFGNEVGDIECIDLYQRHRDRQDWAWPVDEDGDEFYEVCMPAESVDDERPVALLLSVSDPVPLDRVRAALGCDPLLYEIRAKAIGREFLQSRRRVEVFGQEVAKLLTQIREGHEHNHTVHVFAAVPAPLAIEFGRTIKPFDPPFTIYEYRKADRTFFSALMMNTRAR